MTDEVVSFDLWIRSSFPEMNTALEEIYLAQEDRTSVGEAGTGIRQQLVEEGRGHVARLLDAGSTNKYFDSFDIAFSALGNVGMYMAACRRHEITDPGNEGASPLVEASTLALHLGARLGVTPRFATSHLTSLNQAINGRYKTFTSLPAEAVFLDFNTLGVLAYQKAADALVRVLPMGISHPVAYELLCDAEDALRDVMKWNDMLYCELDVERFFYSVRPYYKPHRVGSHVYRGANAGDFSAINELDILLGVCGASDSSYGQILADKFLYMVPEDQARLRDCMGRQSLLQGFLEAIPEHASTGWFQKNGGKFMDVCGMHGQAATQHHEQLVRRFIERPASELPKERLRSITASGPPLESLLRSLETLKDLRIAAERDDIPSCYREFRALRGALGHSRVENVA